jgi:hypothetical protein
MSSEPTPQQVLATPMQPNDAGAITVRAYLVELLYEVWRSREGFSGKRPFGNSGWEHDLYESLGRAGYIRYIEDEHGYCEDMDQATGDRLIALAIRALEVPDVE